MNLNVQFISGHNSRVANPFHGKKHTQEAIEKGRQANLGKPSSRKGKTYEEFYGEKRAKEIKDLSIKGNTFEEFYGEEKAKKIKNSISQTLSGNIPPHKGKTFEEIHGVEGAKKLKERIRKTLTGHIESEETREKKRQNQLGRKYGEETKEKHRQNIIQQIKSGNLDGGGWPHGESYPEQHYREHLESLGYKKGIDFFQEYAVWKPDHIDGIFWKLDFVFLDKMINIEIDGKQHLEPKAIEHDKIRDEWLRNQGWLVMRIPVKKLYQLLKKEGGGTIAPGAAESKLRINRSQVMG